MTEFDYPPTAEYDLGTELATVEQRLADDDLDDAEQARLESQQHALDWAVRQWGEDATVALQGLTATQRSRTVDAARRKTVGQMGGDELADWLVAAQLQTAPWVDPDDELTTRARVTGQLPPALADWLDGKAEELNNLTEGN